jgi:serine/threonine protein kinase
MTPLDVAHRLGTPEYMSPEHWEYGVGACDARSDVFALGVVRGALCAGVIPRVGGAQGAGARTGASAETRADDAPRSATRRRRSRPGAICAPSAALRELAARDPAATREIATVRGLAKADDLAKVLQLRVDAIVLRACASEPTHRHESAAALGVEVRAAL